MKLQLAEGGKPTYKNSSKPFIFIPGMEEGQGTYVREDHFDHVPAHAFVSMLKKLTPHQREVICGSMSEGEYMADKASRRKKRQQRQDDRHEKKQSKISLRKAKGEAKIKRAGSGKGKAIFDKILDTAGGIVGGRSQGGGSAPGSAPDDTNPDGTPKLPFYKTTPGKVAIGAGALLLLVGTGFAIRSRKKKK